MTLEEAIVAALIADAGVNALIGGRVYHIQKPAKPVYPAITYERISTVPDLTLDGPSTFTEVTIEIDCWGAGIAEARALAEAVKTLLNGHMGDLQGVLIQYARMVNQDDFADIDGDFKVRRVSLDFSFTLHE